MQPGYYIGLAVVVLLCAASTGAHAEVIKRVNPNGTVTYIVPQTAPSAATPEAPKSPCAQKPWDPTEVHGARDAYQASLARLRTAPTDPQCREQALYFGRLYSASTRRDGRVTIYDEMAVANDVNAAAGGTVTIQNPGGLVPGAAPLPGSPVPSTGPSQ